MQKTVWLIDLDNTLHDARGYVFPHINRSMTRYLMAELDCGLDHADRLRRHYWERYGATLTGMMRHHGTQAAHFLRHTHQFPDLAQALEPTARLHAVLAQLPGRKILFSNSPWFYSTEVLRLLGVQRFFHGVCSIEQMRFEPKPRRRSYLCALRRHKIAPRECVLVDDVLENLRAAKRLGMSTVWISRERRDARFIDQRIAAFSHLPRHLHRLLGSA